MTDSSEKATLASKKLSPQERENVIRYWLAAMQRWFSYNDEWKEKDVEARRLIEELLDEPKAHAHETSDARDAARYRYIRNCLHCPETDLLITSRSKAPAECGVYSTNILDAIVDDAIKATSQKTSE